MPHLRPAAILWSLMLSSAAFAPEDGQRQDFDFGYVIVHHLETQTAMAEGQAAKPAAREVLGLADVRFAIVEANYTDMGWGELSKESYPVYRWAFKNASDPSSIRLPDYVLRHEIGHDLFVRYLVPNTQSGQYGGDAPDWLDEMAAIAFEGTEQKTGRRRVVSILAEASKLMPLSKFLVMTHLELENSSPPPPPMRHFEWRKPHPMRRRDFTRRPMPFTNF